MLLSFVNTHGRVLEFQVAPEYPTLQVSVQSNRKELLHILLTEHNIQTLIDALQDWLAERKAIDQVEF
jgi:aspartyl/asparaginyl beta-hydroxylase (cupin superfamily)